MDDDCASLSSSSSPSSSGSDDEDPLSDPLAAIRRTPCKGAKKGSCRSTVKGRSIPIECEDGDHRFLELIKDGKNVKAVTVKECKAYLSRHGLRLTGAKPVLIERIRTHLEIQDDSGKAKYPESTFTINCTGDACIGDVVLFKQRVYDDFNIAARASTQPSVGERIIAGRIIRESYGAAKQQHTFTVEVLWCRGERPLPPLHPLIIKGRNLYRFQTLRQPWTDEEERKKKLQEKHCRGYLARQVRCQRMTKLQKKHSIGSLAQMAHLEKTEQKQNHDNPRRGKALKGAQGTINPSADQSKCELGKQKENQSIGKPKSTIEVAGCKTVQNASKKHGQKTEKAFASTQSATDRRPLTCISNNIVNSKPGILPLPNTLTTGMGSCRSNPIMENKPGIVPLPDTLTTSRCTSNPILESKPGIVPLQDALTTGSSELVMQFNRSVAGLLIGKRGSFLAELRQATGADVKLRDSGPICMLIIKGTSEQIRVVKYVVTEKTTCKFFRQSGCSKGNSCSFSHSVQVV